MNWNEPQVDMNEFASPDLRGLWIVVCVIGVLVDALEILLNPASDWS